jgi:plasmid replication initiation protein
MHDHAITPLEAIKIYDAANGDFETIKRVYKHFKNKQLDNFIGAIISMVKPGAFQKPKYNAPKNKFNDYEQRDYDYGELEKKLLGWDKQ